MKRLAAIAATVGLLLPLLLVTPARAHLPGQPSFLKINDSFVDYYPVKQPSSSVIDVPQSTDINRHMPGEELRFQIDKKLLSVAYDNVDRMDFRWSFGDGSTGEGERLTHTYAQPGNYILKIHGVVDGKPQLIESSVVYVLPDMTFQRPRVYISVNGKEVKNDSETLSIPAGQEVTFSARLTPDSASADSYQWDFGDGKTASGQTVRHTYDESYETVYPMVRAQVAGIYFADNSAQLANPSNSGGFDLGTWYASAKQSIESSLASVFGDKGTNYSLAILILLFAIVAGALHSLTPGHGKSILAALLIGRNSNKYRDLAILTASITIAHTIVIYAIGFVFLALDSSRSVNSLLPYFERVSAALVFILAGYLIYTGVRRYRHTRAHAQGHEHSHHGRDHQHGNSLAARLSRRGETWSLIVAGAGGGIVPCIDALSLMLLAAGLGHAGFGLVLVLFFSLGLAGTIAAIGLLLLAGKRRLVLSETTEQNVATYAPLVSGAIILVLAVFLIV